MKKTSANRGAKKKMIEVVEQPLGREAKNREGF